MIGRPGSPLSLEDIVAGTRLLWRLPSFLRQPIGREEARATLRRRLERREADLLMMIRRAVSSHPRNPYQQLLSLAGCEDGDLERLVRQEGAEGALRALYRHGVYLTVEELKGRRAAVRGSASVLVDPARLRNPEATSHLPSGTSGSRGPRTVVPIDLAALRDRAINRYLILEARGGLGWQYALWAVPGGSAINKLLQYAIVGTPFVHWFSQLDPAAPGLHPRYRWSARALRWGSLLAGVPLPGPRHVPPEGPLPIARWMAQVLRGGDIPSLRTFPTSAVRLCQAASDAGLDLRGARFEIGGEPTTAARLAAIRRLGADASPSYASVESGSIARACLSPAAPDDLHLFHDFHALIQPGPDRQDGGLPPGALLLSTLRPTASLILLNASTGDQAVVTRRACDCPMERLGWTTHLHTIRSFEKLTAGGMTFLDTDVIRVLEVVLPARFGGAPTDYQLLEEEADDGRPCLRLLVHPAVGPLDAGAVTDAFLQAIGPGVGVERLMGLLWREAGFVRVERRPPRTTANGKILHLHVERGAGAASARSPRAPGPLLGEETSEPIVESVATGRL